MNKEFTDDTTLNISQSALRKTEVKVIFNQIFWPENLNCSISECHESIWRERKTNLK